MKNIANEYVANDLKCRVLSASPHELICMLFDGILVSLARARYLLEQGDKPAASKEIGRSITILNDGLIGSLEGVGEDAVANDLHNLYELCVRALLRARVSADTQAILQVEGMILPISHAWREIGTKRQEALTQTA